MTYVDAADAAANAAADAAADAADALVPFSLLLLC